MTRRPTLVSFLLAVTTLLVSAPGLLSWMHTAGAVTARTPRPTPHPPRPTRRAGPWATPST
jgi:hypothetical protein